MRRWPVLEAFRHAEFRIVFGAGFVSQLGDWMQIFGRAALAYELTGSASSVGLVYFASYSPHLLFSLWGGVMADRFERRTLLLATQSAQAVGAIAFGAIVATDTATIASIAILSFLLGCAFMISVPVSQALAPAVVPPSALSSAISLTTATNAFTRVFGPLLGALIISTLGLSWVFWLNAVTFVFVLVAWTTVTLPAQPKSSAQGNLKALSESLRYVARTPAVAVPIGVNAFLMLVGLVYQPFAVVYATKVLAGGSTSIGQDYFSWIQAALGAGAAAGVLMSAGIGRRNPASTFTTTALAFSLALVFLGRMDHFAGAMAVLVMIGAFHYANMALAINLVQHEVPEALRGRVMSILSMGTVGVVPLTSIVGGPIVARFGTTTVFTSAGLLCFAFSLMMFRWKRHLHSYVVEAEPTTTIAAVGVLLEEEA